MSKSVDIVIIGGGASGLMLSSLLNHQNVVIIDKNQNIASKIAISGGGKCNITNKNLSYNNYLGDKNFISYAIKEFNSDSLIKWLKIRGLNSVIKNESQYFCKDSAKEIINIFKKETKHHKIMLNSEVISISKRGDIFEIITNRSKLLSKKVVIASGGLSYQSIGATDIGYKIAKSFNHTINTTSPALVGFTLQKDQFFFKELSGASTEVSIKVANKIFKGSLLFTHKGISGPVILNTSLYWQKGLIEIDFLNGFDIYQHRNSKKLISSVLPMPKRVTKAFLVKFDIEDIALNQLSNKELEVLNSLNSYSFAPAGNFGYTKAEVTRGGVNTDEINSKTMMSKIVPNLYFIGEVLDVTGELGGYNFQWAFSSAYVCAKDLNEL